MAVSEPYLQADYGEEFDRKAPVELLVKWMHGVKDTPDEQVVVLSQVLDAPINMGYEDVANVTVLRFNGVKIRNLAHLASLVENCKDEYLTFELDHDEVVVVNRRDAIESSQEILETHCIPAVKSIGPMRTKSRSKPKKNRMKRNTRKKLPDARI